MSNPMVQLQEATIKAQCKTLRMPMVASQFGTLAEQAIRGKQSHIGYLEALLLAEVEERERNTIERRIREAHLPRVKTLGEFDYTQSPNVTAAKMRDLAEGGYIDRAEPVLFIGECGTGKTHLLTDSAWLPVGRSAGYVLPLRPVWSMNWWRPSISYSFGA
jgi:DNA replication protein DnaC